MPGRSLDPEPLVVNEYRAMLRRFAEDEEHGMSINAVVEASGLGRTTVWRVLTEDKPATVAAAEIVRRTLLQMRPDLEIPPPLWSVQDQLHAAWIEAGETLRAIDEEQFRELLGIAVDKADAISRDREIMERIRRLQRAGGSDRAVK